MSERRAQAVELVLLAVLIPVVLATVIHLL